MVAPHRGALPPKCFGLPPTDCGREAPERKNGKNKKDRENRKDKKDKKDRENRKDKKDKKDRTLVSPVSLVAPVTLVILALPSRSRVSFLIPAPQGRT